jgi:tetratricopeptide (TPR) repeat protein
MPTKGLPWWGVALLALLVSLSPAARAERSEARKAYDEATAAFGLGRYGEAAEKYETAFSLRPDPALLYDAAQAYRLSGNRARALELYRNYLRLYPDRLNAEEARSQVAALGKAIEDDKQAALAPGPAATPIASPPPPVASPAPPTLMPAPPAGSPGVSQTVAAGVVTSPADEPAAGTGSRTWLWIAAGAAVVVVGTVAIVLATRGDKFPDATWGTATGARN